MYFAIRKSIDNQYYFVIVGNNHEDIATSEMYTTKYSAQKSIAAIKNSVNDQTIVVDVSDSLD